MSAWCCPREGLRTLFARHGCAWRVSRVGARCEFQFCAQPPRDGRAARAAMDHAPEATLHLYLLNRGILLTPFHNMMLCSPATLPADVDALLAVFESALLELAPA